MENDRFRKINNFNTSGGISTNLLEDKLSDDFNKNLLCNICLEILLKPLQCKECKNKYCLFCITNWNKIDKKCPICKKSGTEDIDIKIIEKLHEIKLKCFNNSEKCSKLTQYSEFEDHLESCEFAEYESTIPKCNYKGNLFEVKGHLLNCNCNKELSKTNQLLKDFNSNYLSTIVYSKKKTSYNCINGLIFIPEYDYLLVGNSKGELIIINTDTNKIIHEKKNFKYISLLYYVKRSNILLVGTINGGLYALSMNDFRELFFVKTNHMFVDFLVELYYPTLAITDREDFITLVNYNDKEIKNIINTGQKINRIITWEEKGLLIAGCTNGNIIFYNYFDFSIVFQKENAHSGDYYLHCIELDKINNILISGGYDGFIRKWKIEDDNLVIKLSLLFEINRNLQIITGIFIDFDYNFFYFLNMDKLIHKVNYSDGKIVVAKPLDNTIAACGFVRLPESTALIIGDYKLPILKIIDYNAFF